MSARYACIAAHADTFAITLMCRVLGVSATGYHAARRRPPSARAHTDEALLVTSRTVHRRSRRRYGAPRVHAELRAEGHHISRKRVARLMQSDGLVGRRRRRFVRTTDARHGYPVAANVVARQFAPATIGAPDRVWASDITYLPTRQGWLYLAVILDLATRAVVGWATASTLGEGLVLAAWYQAFAARQPRRGLVVHSDRGSQYAGRAFQRALAVAGAVPSMSRTGDCWDNAVAESFFATLKGELVDDADWPDARAAWRALFEFIEVWYNRQRRHSTLGYRTPAEYETVLLKQDRAA